MSDWEGAISRTGAAEEVGGAGGRGRVDASAAARSVVRSDAASVIVLGRALLVELRAEGASSSDPGAELLGAWVEMTCSVLVLPLSS